MITLYYIGGPWDLTKRALPREPAPEITVREFPEPPSRAYGSESVEISYRDHRYIAHKIAPEIFVAVHESIS